MRTTLKETHRLPNGKWTTSLKVYLREWNKLKRKVEKKLNVKVYGFDPDFGVYSKTEPRQVAHIPLWLALTF